MVCAKIITLNIVKNISFFLGFYFFVSCNYEDTGYTVSSDIPANYSYFLKVTVSEGGIVTCYPYSEGIGVYYGISNKHLPCRNNPKMDGIKFKVPMNSQALLVAEAKDGYTFEKWSTGLTKDSLIVNLDNLNNEFSAFFYPIE